MVWMQLAAGLLLHGCCRAVQSSPCTSRSLLPTWQRGPMSTRGIREETSPMPGLKASQLRGQWLHCCGLSWSHRHPIQTGSADCQGTDGRLWSVEFGPGTPLNPNVLGQFWRTSRSLPTRAACCHHSCVLQTAQTPDHPCPCVEGSLFPHLHFSAQGPWIGLISASSAPGFQLLTLRPL